jgi:tetratricopeptide (TPR) repeat protein
MRHQTFLIKPLRLAVTLFVCLTQTSPVAAQTKRAELTARQIAQRTFPSVVVLVTEDRRGDKYLGSGFFIDDDVVATNYHVIKGATKIVARRVGQKHVYQVSILSTDEESDLALLRLDGAIARPLTLARGGRIAVGDVVYVAGNPEGLEGTFSQGIVSALRGTDYVQITAPISHGSSGGPVLNSRGEVIGVAVGAIEEGQNLNFAIPISQLLPQVTRARLLGRRPIATNPPRKSVTGTKDETEGQLDKGRQLRSQERYAEAAEAFKSALRLKPDDTNALLGLADTYSLLNKYQEAIDAYNDVIRTHPKDADDSTSAGLGLPSTYTKARLGLAGAYEGLHKYQEAIDVYDDLIRARPQEEHAYENLSRLLWLKLGRQDEAIDVLRRGLKTIPKSNLYIHLAGLLEFLDRMPEAEGVLNTAVQKSDDPSFVYALLGDHYCHRLKRCSDAIPYYKLAIDKVQQNPLTLTLDLSSFHYRLGAAYLQAGDRASAIREYRLLKSLNSDYAQRLFDEIYK